MLWGLFPHFFGDNIESFDGDDALDKPTNVEEELAKTLGAADNERDEIVVDSMDEHQDRRPS